MNIKQNNMHIFATILLISLSLVSALILETQLTNWAALEIIIILFASLFVTTLLFGLWLDEPWAKPLGMVYFSLMIANLLWMFAFVKTFIPFVFGILVNVSGIVLAIASIERMEAPVDIETYHP